MDILFFFTTMNNNDINAFFKPAIEVLWLNIYVSLFTAVVFQQSPS